MAAPPASIALSPLAFSTMFRVIGSRGEAAPSPASSRGARQPIDQPDFAAAVRRHVGAVHPVDDARQHKARLARIEQRAIEQLEIERRPDADGFVREIGLVRGDIAIELVVERPANRRHRRQREQLRRWSAGTSTDLAGSIMRPRPNLARGRVRASAQGSVIAVPRSSAAPCAACAGTSAAEQDQERDNEIARVAFSSERRGPSGRCCGN